MHDDEMERMRRRQALTLRAMAEGREIDPGVERLRAMGGGVASGPAPDLAAEVRRLRAALERLASSETFTAPMALGIGLAADELRARIDFARATLQRTEYSRPSTTQE